VDSLGHTGVPSRGRGVSRLGQWVDPGPVGGPDQDGRPGRVKQDRVPQVIRPGGKVNLAQERQAQAGRQASSHGLKLLRRAHRFPRLKVYPPFGARKAGCGG
jgi:hypothetical protein